MRNEWELREVMLRNEEVMLRNGEPQLIDAEIHPGYAAAGFTWQVMTPGGHVLLGQSREDAIKRRQYYIDHPEDEARLS